METSMLFAFSLILIIINPSFQNVHDLSFINYCNRAGGQLTLPTGSNSKPTGGKCKFVLDLPTSNDEEARENCDRWGIHSVKSARLFNDYTECIVENIYSCKDTWQQINGMCYKKMPEQNVQFSRAQETCRNVGAELVKPTDLSFGEILEDQFEVLSRYFVQPSEEYEKWAIFSGGSGPNYVILFDDAHFYGTGANSIMRFAPNTTADIMCAYRPEETAVSLAAKSERLKSFYYPSVMTSDMSVWRSAGFYSRTSLPAHDVCEASMKALIGSNQGTLMEMNPQETQQLSRELRDSFVQSFAPFADCRVRDDYDSYRVYFKRKGIQDRTCVTWPPISENDYKAKFHRDQSRKNDYSYVFYSKLSGSYEIEGRRHAIHGPMLCGLIHVPQEIPRFKCPDGWGLFARSRQEGVCHRFYREYQKRHEGAVEFCRQNGGGRGRISRWASFEEFEFVRYIANEHRWNPCSVCGPWVACFNENGCADSEQRGNLYPYMGPLTTGAYENYEWATGHQVCEMPATPI